LTQVLVRPVMREPRSGSPRGGAAVFTADPPFRSPQLYELYRFDPCGAVRVSMQNPPSAHSLGGTAAPGTAAPGADAGASTAGEPQLAANDRHHRPGRAG
jgi:hypothetical protein